MRYKQLGGLAPVLRRVPLRCKANKLKYPLMIPPEIKIILLNKSL